MILNIGTEMHCYLLCGPMVIVVMLSRPFGGRHFRIVDQMGEDILGVDLLGIRFEIRCYGTIPLHYVMHLIKIDVTCLLLHQ